MKSSAPFRYLDTAVTLIYRDGARRLADCTMLHDNGYYIYHLFNIKNLSILPS
jgi:hypothetical protein